MNSRGILTICSAVLCAVAFEGRSDTITVINTNDSGSGSLRQALADAQNGDTIVFKLGGAATISLTSSELVINKDIAITGPGANLLTIARAQDAPGFRIFHVAPAHTVTIQDVTITNGSGLDGFAIGGAGVWNDHSNLTVNNCVVTGNAVDRQVSGGGISNDAGNSGAASLTINNSIISGNDLGATGTVNFGGGIYNYGIHGNATLTINNSTISGNQSFQGGGIFSDGGVPDSIALVTINNSTFSGNYADQYAGGIMNEANEGGQATVTVTNSTFAGNSSCNCNFFGGAIFNDGSRQPGGATLEMGNTIFKGGPENPANIFNQGGVVISDGYNLTNDAGVLNTNGGIGDFNAPGDQINTDPMLGPLQDNGGLTPTHELLLGSPAIDAGDPKFTPPPFFDQRGPSFDRVMNGRIDKGAFEVQAAPGPQYQIYDIGVIQPGDTASQGFGVSRAGIAVGRSLRTGGSQAFTWTLQGGIVGLPNLTGRNYAVSNSANDTGVVVGTAATTAFGSSRLPVIWQNGVVSQLPLPSGETLGDANSVNSSTVAVGSVDSGSNQRGVIYSGGSATIITQTTAGGSYFLTAFGINDSGRVVGQGIDPQNAARNVGIVYDIGQPMAFEVGALPGMNGALAFGVSNTGYVVGSSMLNQGSGLPFIWSDQSGIVAIPLAPGTSQGSARAVNSAGWVVGDDSSAFSIPFLFDGTTTYRLADLIPPNSGWDLSMNTSSSALGISEDGVIVGTGVHNGDTHAYAMVPMAPSPTPTPTASATATPTPAATATPTSTPTPTATPTSTATSTPRIAPTPRSRPTPAPRP